MMMKYAPQKRQYAATRLHGAIFQKVLIFIYATVRTWSLTNYFHFTASEKGADKLLKYVM
jgi:hypothetical protein